MRESTHSTCLNRFRLIALQMTRAACSGGCRVFERLEHPGSAALLHPRRLENVGRHSTRMNTGNTDIGIGQFNIEALAEARYRELCR